MCQECQFPTEECNCRKKHCPRYEKCEECRNYHYNKDTLPYCERKEKQGHASS